MDKSWYIPVYVGRTDESVGGMFDVGLRDVGGVFGI